MKKLKIKQDSKKTEKNQNLSIGFLVKRGNPKSNQLNSLKDNLIKKEVPKLIYLPF